jgi:ADP-ribose pyrophosphatase
MISKWNIVKTLSKENFKIFDIMLLRKEHPLWKKESNFVVIDSPKWVNIIPITKEGKIVLIEQYRHGTDNLTLEIPGGLVENGEEPRLAAERECIEETGYSCDIESIYLGETEPNPAFMNNICYTYLWKNVEKTKNQQLDGNEEIRVFEVTMDELKVLIKDGKIKHSLVLNAFFYYFINFENLIK